MVAIGEVSVIIAVVGWFVGPNAKELMDWARSYATSKFKWHTGLQKKLEKLAENLEEINCLVGATRAAFVNDHARIGRLWRLKDAIHDAEDLLDTFEYQILEANLRKSRRDGKASGGDPSTAEPVTIGTKESLGQLNKLLERLEGLCKRSHDLFQVSQSGVRPMSRPIRGPTPTRDKLFGYDGQYRDLLTKLTRGDAEVVAIIGHGGMGKTELACRAFNNQDVRAKFDLFIWVSVYGKFTETELLREIWNSAAGARPVGEMNVTSLQVELANIVKSARRYLLVLDDVCNDESAASAVSRRRTWDEVLAPFRRHGGSGSRILMTTRAAICSRTLDGADIVLNGIEVQQDFMRLLKKVAFGNEDAEVNRKLQEAIDTNVGKLHGFPLAAEEVGCMLKGNRNWRKWKEIMSRDHHEGVFQVLLSSYQDLSPQLQRCFAFCSIFPMEWKFDPDKLIKMWTALGFVEGPSEPGGETTEEDVARGYFEALVERSLFQPTTVNNRYEIHEQIHSMLRLVCPTYYLSIDGSRRQPVPGSARAVRHMSVTTGCLDQLMAYPDYGLKTVRTLLVFQVAQAPCSSTTSPLITTIDDKILKKFKGVRVLDFSGTCITELPQSTGELQHLRYLGLPKTIKKLGAHIARLLLLQTLGVVGEVDHSELEELPSDINSLINLRHLCFATDYIQKICGIGSLEKLENSIRFHVGRSDKGHSMRELEKLNSMRPKLSITGLETVTSKQEAKSARLDKKEHLKVLELEWEPRSLRQPEGSVVSDSDVLEGLQPHPNIEKLHIKRYPGTTSPSWLNDANLLQNLRSLHLRNCNQLQAMPPVGRLPLLKLLEIKGMASVRSIGDLFCNSGGFRSLERMVLDDMPELEAWDAASCGDSPPILFPRLTEVRIVDCNKLSSMPGLLCCRESLMKLHVARCPALRETFRRNRFPFLQDPGIYIDERSNLQFQE